MGAAQSGLQGVAELAYSPQGFWALGVRATGDDQGALEPALVFRGGLDIFQLVPRLDLSVGYAQGLTWAVNMGVDYFVMRQVALRAAGGVPLAWASRVG
jgi:hypothetical protein